MSMGAGFNRIGFQNYHVRQVDVYGGRVGVMKPQPSIFVGLFCGGCGCKNVLMNQCVLNYKKAIWDKKKKFFQE